MSFQISQNVRCQLRILFFWNKAFIPIVFCLNLVNPGLDSFEVLSLFLCFLLCFFQLKRVQGHQIAFYAVCFGIKALAGRERYVFPNCQT